MIASIPRLRALRLIAVVLALLAFPAAAQAAANVSIFYYPWYGTPASDGGWVHWLAPGASTLDIASNYYPARGLYSSSNQRVVAAQMREIAAGGVDEVVSSWWGWGSPEDVRLPLVSRTAHAAGLAVAIHLEPYPGRTIESVEADIEHLRGLGIDRFFVYRPFDIPEEEWAALRDRIDGVQLFAQTALAGRAAAARFDGVYTYDVLLWGAESFPRLCKQAHKAGLACLPSVGPGYDASRATGDLRVKPRRDGKTYDGMWKSAIRSGADGVTITSYNEWHEGTQIEPARGPTARSASAAACETYDGAYGLQGRPAQRAYLGRTAFWTAAFSRARPTRPQLLP
jgi:glycoprotein endo-alpha-1,2-mannosidase